MQINKKDLEKSQIELTVELSVEEFAPFVEKGAQKVSEQVKIEGFRPGKVPLEILKQKIGEMTILEEAARLAINKTIDEAIEKNTMDRQAFGQPDVSITKLAPGNPLEYKVVLSILPEVALGKYKGLAITVVEPELDAAELERALADLREMRASEKLVEREIASGDKIIVDVKIFLDKVPLEDGVRKDLAVLTGKNYFVPGFDDKMIGAKAGDERKFDLPYPNDHHQKNLAGKMVTFEVVVKAVYERILPELNDEFAGFFRLKDLAELKKNLSDSLLHEKKHQAEHRDEARLMEAVIADTKFGDLPEPLIDSESRNMMAELEQSVVRQGGKFEDYLQHLKKTADELMLEMLPNAIRRVKSALVIREIALIEKINPSDAEIQAKIEELKKAYAGNEEVSKMIAEPGYRHYLKNVLTNEQVIGRLKEWNYVPAGTEQKG